jgi:hypothetical protein
MKRFFLALGIIGCGLVVKAQLPEQPIVRNNILTITRDEVVSLVDEVSADTMYVGYSVRNNSRTDTALFKIKLIVKDSTVTKIMHPDGVDTYTKIWDNRKSYTYKY